MKRGGGGLGEVAQLVEWATSKSGGWGFDSCSGHPLPIGLVSVSIM